MTTDFLLGKMEVATEVFKALSKVHGGIVSTPT